MFIFIKVNSRPTYIYMYMLYTMGAELDKGTDPGMSLSLTLRDRAVIDIFTNFSGNNGCILIKKKQKKKHLY